MNPIKIWLADAKAPPDVRHVDVCDGFRTMAILLVGWFHIWQQSWLYPGLTLFGRHISLDPIVRSGYIWVDLMILISGFCLYLPWARLEKEAPAPRALPFYQKRLVRIEPSYLLTLFVMLGAALVGGAGMPRGFLAKDFLTHLTFTHMFFYDTYYASNMGGALWTLALEMQLYLLFPLLARAFRKRPRVTFFALVGAALAFRAWVAASFADIGLLFNQLPAYIDVFACGMLAAHVHVCAAKTRHNALTRILCSAAGVGVLWLLLAVARSQSGCAGTEAIRLGQMNRRLAMGILGGALLVFGANAGLVFRRIWGNPLTRFFSLISMQFYIWHQTLAVWLREARIVPSIYENPNYAGDLLWQQRYTLLCFTLSLALAALITFAFERPMAKKLQNRK